VANYIMDSTESGIKTARIHVSK